MKIRNGFVSNSSSSSFIMIGVSSTVLKNPISSDGGIKTLYLEREDADYVSGYIIADDEYLEDGTLSVAKVIEYSDELSRKLKVPASDVKIYYGVRPS